MIGLYFHQYSKDRQSPPDICLSSARRVDYPGSINFWCWSLVGGLEEECASLGDHLGHGLLQLGAILDQVDHPERQEGFREWNGMVGEGGAAEDMLNTVGSLTLLF